MLGHELEPDGLVVAVPAALDEVTAHQADMVAQAARDELLVQRPVQGFVLRERHLCRVGLVLDRDPADVVEAARPHEVLEDRGELAHEQRRAGSSPAPR